MSIVGMINLFLSGFSFVSKSCLTFNTNPIHFVMIGGDDSMNNKLYEEVLEAGYKVGKQLDVLNHLTIISYAYFIESIVFFASCIITARSIT